MADPQDPVIRSDGTSTPRQTALAIIKLQQQVREILKKLAALAPPGP